MLSNIYHYQDMLKKEGISLSFMGPLSQRLMEEFVGNMREQMSQEGVDTSTIMKVFAVAVEQVQNVLRFSAEAVPSEGGQRPVKLHIGSVHIGYEHGHYVVASGNQIASENVELLQEQLTTLTSMTKHELKILQKDIRKQTLDFENQTRLGLIEISRKASQPLEFEFRKLDEHRTFFSMKTVI